MCAFDVVKWSLPPIPHMRSSRAFFWLRRAANFTLAWWRVQPDRLNRMLVLGIESINIRETFFVNSENEVVKIIFLFTNLSSRLVWAFWEERICWFPSELLNTRGKSRNLTPLPLNWLPMGFKDWILVELHLDNSLNSNYNLRVRQPLHFMDHPSYASLPHFCFCWVEPSDVVHW